MNQNIKITIEEWINDNSIIVTDEQVNELIDAIDICSEIEINSRGLSLGYKPKTKEELKIEELEKKLHILECFIRQKGFSINYNSEYVTEHKMKRISNSHWASDDKTTYY